MEPPKIENPEQTLPETELSQNTKIQHKSHDIHSDVKEINELSKLSLDSPEIWARTILSLTEILNRSIQKTPKMDWVSDDTAQNILARAMLNVNDIAETLDLYIQQEHKLHVDPLSTKIPESPLLPDNSQEMNKLTTAISELSQIVKQQGETITRIETVIKSNETRTTPSPRLSFAQVASTPSRNSPSAYRPKSHHTTPHHYLRYIVRFGNNPPPKEKLLQSETATRKLNDFIQSKDEVKNELTVLAVTSKPNGNYIITYTDNSSPDKAEAIKDEIPNVLAPGHPNVIVSKDVPWAKFFVHGVPFLDYNQQPKSSKALLEAFNTNINTVNAPLAQEPRWINIEEKINQGKRFSSFTIAFIDTNGELTNRINQGRLYLFGEQVRIERWKQNPKSPQCKICWKTNHLTKSCTDRVPKCRLCGKPGKEEDHKKHCDACLMTPEDKRTGECHHVACANCHSQEHSADFPNCPKRQERLPFKTKKIAMSKNPFEINEHLDL
jgi:hypothetical protein